VKPEEELFFNADANLIEVAINNLLENAVKYSDPPAAISVVLSKDEEHVHIQVTDKGIGIPANELERIFQRFYTFGQARTKKFKSSGLGLSIVETIIEKHFGNITLQSEVGVGSTFTISLPIEHKFPDEE